MRSFLRGSLYGVTASTGWIGPQQPSSTSSSAIQNQFQANQQQGTTTATSPNNNTSVRSTADAAAVQQQAYNHHHHHAAAAAARHHHHATTPLQFATRASYGGFPIYGANVSESETATLRAERSVRGKVSKWFDQRGFGFIEDDETQQQYFVHARDLITVEGGQKSLFIGQTVEFEPEQTDNGGHAMRVSGPGGAPLQAGASTNATAERQPVPSYVPVAPESDNNKTIEQQVPPTTIAAIANQSTSAAFPNPRVLGTIAHWTADKGYGFVAVAGQDEHFFTHIKDFTCPKPEQSPSMPTAGLEIEFTPSYAGNKKRATHVSLPNCTPFEPNVIATPAPVPAPVKQQQQSNNHHHHVSSLALAFAIPEKKSAVKTVVEQTSSTTSTTTVVTSSSHPDPLWRAGYTIGFVEGQQYLKKEINNLPIATPLPKSSNNNTTSNQQQQQITQRKTVVVERVSNNNNSNNNKQQYYASQQQQQQQVRSSSNRSTSSVRSVGRSPRSSSSSNNSNKQDLWSNEAQRQQQTTSASSSSNKSSAEVSANTPKWASQQSWASASATPVGEEPTTTKTVSAVPVESSSNNTTATNNVEEQQQPRRGGFPSFSRGGFGRGRGHGGRGL